jgi:hypothetical protein
MHEIDRTLHCSCRLLQSTCHCILRSKRCFDMMQNSMFGTDSFSSNWCCLDKQISRKMATRSLFHPRLNIPKNNPK